LDGLIDAQPHSEIVPLDSGQAPSDQRTCDKTSSLNKTTS